MHKLSCDQRYGGERTLRPGPDAPDEPPNDRFRGRGKYSRKSALVDSKARRSQTRLAHAGDAVDRQRPGRAGGVSGDAEIAGEFLEQSMSSDALAIETA